MVSAQYGLRLFMALWRLDDVDHAVKMISSYSGNIFMYVAFANVCQFSISLCSMRSVARQHVMT